MPLCNHLVTHRFCISEPRSLNDGSYGNSALSVMEPSLVQNVPAPRPCWPRQSLPPNGMGLADFGRGRWSYDHACLITRVIDCLI